MSLHSISCREAISFCRKSNNGTTRVISRKSTLHQLLSVVFPRKSRFQRLFHFSTFFCVQSCRNLFPVDMGRTAASRGRGRGKGGQGKSSDAGKGKGADAAKKTTPKPRRPRGPNTFVKRSSRPGTFLSIIFCRTTLKSSFPMYIVKPQPMYPHLYCINLSTICRQRVHPCRKVSHLSHQPTHPCRQTSPIMCATS